MRSTRQQLLLLLAGILIGTFSLTGLLNYLATAEEVQELFDAQLIENARVLKGVMNHSEEHVDWDHMRKSLEETRREVVPDDDPMASGHAYEKKVAIQVWTEDGELVLRSPSAPEYSLSPLKEGFYRRQHERHSWHIYTTQMDENENWLIVAERSDVREELSRNVAASLGLGSLLGFALALWLMHLGLKRELRPLESLRQAIGQRDPDKLDPIRLEETRAELQPVVEALNTLMRRVNDSVERERRFLADAAHELRTPLAVLKLQAQTALAAADPAEARAALERLVSGVDRSTRVVEQLLLLARLDANAVPVDPAPVAMDELAREVLAQLAPLAMARGQELGLEVAGGAGVVRGNSALLHALLRNLVENAMRHTPEGGEIRVLLSGRAESLCLEVCDSGPGVDPALLGRLTGRFVCAHPADAQGSGLGLAIVALVVELHRGTLELANLAPHGLRASVTLPR
jgi:two-component system sensor histidine kinase QseC